MQIKVVQVFRKYAAVSKPLFNSQFRSDFDQWPVKLTSPTGFLEGDQLFLNESFSNLTRFNKGVVVLMDTVSASHSIAAPEAYYNFGRYSQQKFDIFHLKHTKEDTLALYTHFEDLSHFTSFPQAQNHQLAILHPGNPIRYQTNNRIDNTASGFRKQRRFLLWDVIFEYVGDARSVDFLPSEKLNYLKSINSKGAREIDERKIIW